MTIHPTSLPSAVVSPVSSSAPVPAISNSNTPESGGFQAALDRGLQAEVPEQKSAGVLPSSKGPADSGTPASGTWKKTGKEAKSELATVGLALSALPDLLTALPLIPAPQQSSSIVKLPAETVADGTIAAPNGVQSSNTREADFGTPASGAGKTGKEAEPELGTIGLALPAVPDLLANVPLIPAPQQSSLAPKLSAEIVAAEPSAGSSGTQSSETGKVTQAQELAPVTVRTPLLPENGTNAVPTQSGIAIQNARGAAVSPDVVPWSKQAASSTASAFLTSASAPAASSTPVLPAPVLPALPHVSASSSVQPVVAKDGSKQGLAIDAAGIPTPATSSVTSVTVSPNLSAPNLSSQNPVVPSLLVPQVVAAPASKLTGIMLNASRSSPSADSRPKQSGGAFEPSSSVPGEDRSTLVHTSGSASAIEPSALVVADANGLSSSVMPTENAVLSAPLTGASGHAAADVSGGPTSAGLPAASTANMAAQVAAVAAPSINTAKVLETIHGTELRLGLHSTEFGSISIATLVSPGGIAAQIALDHGALGKALATHLTSMEEKLGSSFGLPAKVELRDGPISGSQGSGAGTANGGENSRGYAKPQRTGREAEPSARVAEGFSGSVPAAESRAATGSGVRLSVQA